MTEDVELKACPFCGDEVELELESNPDPEQADRKPVTYLILCSGCGHIMEGGLYLDELIDSWNTRPIEDHLKQEADIRIDELVELLSEALDRFKQYGMEVDDGADV